MLDHEGYPHDEDLEKVRTWDLTKDFNVELPKFLDFIQENWWSPDWGWHIKEEEEDGKKKNKLYLSTGGWSGNEDMIAAMKQNFIFWTMCWEQSRRGGHYIFEIKTIKQLKDAKKSNNSN